jgi:hypothetical protein
MSDIPSRLSEVIYILLSQEARDILKKYKYYAYCISGDIIILVGTCYETNRLFFEANFENMSDLEDYILTKIGT